MIDPVTMFHDGGVFMYLILGVGLLQLGATVAQLSSMRKGWNLMPLLWALVGSQVLLGLLGSTMGAILTFNAVAHAAAETKQALLAQGLSISMFTTAAGLMMSFMGTLCNGIVHSMVVNSRR